MVVIPGSYFERAGCIFYREKMLQLVTEVDVNEILEWLIHVVCKIFKKEYKPQLIPFQNFADPWFFRSSPISLFLSVLHLIV